MSMHAYTAEPLSQMRRAISARMSDAKRTIPHFRLTGDVEVGALLADRAALNAREPGARVSVTDLVTKACASALMERPELNIQFVDDEIRRFEHAHVSVVIAAGGGVFTPVIWDADKKSVFEISAAIRDFTARASQRRLRLDEIVGGALGVSNLGMHDVEAFDAIINPPQCAMLAVGSIRRGLVCTDEGDARAASLMRLTLSIDHRCIDGVMAAHFMSSLRRAIEQPRGAGGCAAELGPDDA